MAASANSNSQELRARYKQGEGWRELFDMLATYTNRTPYLTVDNAARLTGLAKETIVPLFKELAVLGFGDFKYGRHKHKTRIIWKHSPGSIGLVAKGRRTELVSLIDEELPEPLLEEHDQEANADDLDTRLSLSDILQSTKRELAAKLRISPEQIEITIKH